MAAQGDPARPRKPVKGTEGTPVPLGGGLAAVPGTRLAAALARLTLADLWQALPGAEVVTQYASPGTQAILAGQALGSALSRLLGGVDHLPVNDYDVFLKAPGPPAVASTAPLPALHGLPATAGGAYADQVISASRGDAQATGTGGRQPGGRQRYRVLSAERVGRVNLIRIHFAQPLASDETFAQRTLADFDFNCCQCALDLHSRVLFYSAAFLDFLSSRTVQVVTAFTPCHTVVRLLRKQWEFAPLATVDLALELEILGWMIHASHPSVMRTFSTATWHAYSEAFIFRGDDLVNVAEDRFRVVPVDRRPPYRWTLQLMPWFADELILTAEERWGWDGLVALCDLAAYPALFPRVYRRLRAQSCAHA